MQQDGRHEPVWQYGNGQDDRVFGKVSFRMNGLHGKRLLVLGAAGGLDYIRAFKEKNGVTVITTADKGHQDNPLFRFADEAYDTSPLDREGLISLCREKRIDGIFPGGNEEIIGTVIDVAGEMGFPFYLTEEQFRLNHDKAYFHEVIRRYGLECPAEYTLDSSFRKSDLEKIRYPVIVKPVDLCGGRGIAPCVNEEELRSNYLKAIELSLSHRAIVEQFITGEEFTVVYTLKDGEISLSLMKDKYMSEDHEYVTTQFDISLSPSKWLGRYCDGPDKTIRKIISDLGIRDGTIFFQGFVSQNRFIFHESGCRMTGAEDFRTIAEVNGINFYEMMLYYSLTGKMQGYELALDDPFFRTPIGMFAVYAHGGVIDRQIGFEKIQAMPNVLKAEMLKRSGDTVTENSALKQRVLRVFIKGKDVGEIAKTVGKIQKEFDVLDEENRSMKFKSFDTERLLAK